MDEEERKARRRTRARELRAIANKARPNLFGTKLWDEGEERLYTDEEREFLHACDRFRERYHRRFLYATDYLEIIKELGYKKEIFEMPSVVLGQPLASGGQNILSGCACPWSGQAPSPVGGVQLRWMVGVSGANCYISLSGGMTVTSGQMFLSGGAASGLLDGMVMTPGDSYYIPHIATGPSGFLSIYALCDGPASGIGRLYWERF